MLWARHCFQFATLSSLKKNARNLPSPPSSCSFTSCQPSCRPRIQFNPPFFSMKAPGKSRPAQASFATPLAPQTREPPSERSPPGPGGAHSSPPAWWRPRHEARGEGQLKPWTPQRTQSPGKAQGSPREVQGKSNCLKGPKRKSKGPKRQKNLKEVQGTQENTS